MSLFSFIRDNIVMKFFMLLMTSVIWEESYKHKVKYSINTRYLTILNEIRKHILSTRKTRSIWIKSFGFQTKKVGAEQEVFELFPRHRENWNFSRAQCGRIPSNQHPPASSSSIRLALGRGTGGLEPEMGPHASASAVPVPSLASPEESDNMAAVFQGARWRARRCRLWLQETSHLDYFRKTGPMLLLSGTLIKAGILQASRFGKKTPPAPSTWKPNWRSLGRGNRAGHAPWAVSLGEQRPSEICGMLSEASPGEDEGKRRETEQ